MEGQIGVFEQELVEAERRLNQRFEERTCACCHGVGNHAVRVIPGLTIYHGCRRCRGTGLEFWYRVVE